jgi:hypothetical protein
MKRRAFIAGLGATAAECWRFVPANFSFDA